MFDAVHLGNLQRGWKLITKHAKTVENFNKIEQEKNNALSISKRYIRQKIWNN